MSDSNNQANQPAFGANRTVSRGFTDIGTIQSANTRRIVEQNINANSNMNIAIPNRQGRGQREEQKNAN